MAEHLIPIAVSSELDITGIERIHAAPASQVVRPAWVAPPVPLFVAASLHDFGDRPASVFSISSDTLVPSPTDEVPAFPYAVVADTAMTYLAFAVNASPGVKLFKRTTGTTLTALSDLDTGPTAAFYADMTDDGEYLAVPQSATGVIYLSKRTGDTFTHLTTYTLPSSHVATKLKWSPDKTYLAVVGSVANVFRVYLYKRTGDTLALLSPSFLAVPGEDFTDVRWSPESDMLLVCSDKTGSSPIAGGHLQIYTVASDVFTLHGNMDSTYPTYTIRGMAFSPNGEYMITMLFYGGFFVFKREGNDFTQLTSPVPNGGIRLSDGGTFTSDSNYIVFGQEDDQLHLVKRTGDTFALVHTLLVGTLAADVVST